MSWPREAACHGEDPEMFFPIGPTASVVFQLAEAKRICARCPVQRPCLELALLTGSSTAYGAGSVRTSAAPSGGGLPEAGRLLE